MELRGQMYVAYPLPKEHYGRSLQMGGIMSIAGTSRSHGSDLSRPARALCGLVALCGGLGVGGTAGAATTVANSWPTTFVAGAAVPTGTSAWFVHANGRVDTYPDIRARSYGDASGLRLSMPITGIAATPTGKGYWLVAGDGGIFNYGDAHFYGSTGNRRLTKPVFSMAPTKDGRGYWLVASDGGVFTFGDAHFYGSLGGRRIDQPIVGLTTTPTGRGYRMVARDGGIFDFGDAAYYGSVGGRGLTDVVGMARTPSGKGYWILRKFGATCFAVYSPGTVPCPIVYHFGDAKNLGWVLSFGESLDFVGDPVVALVANPVAQGYIVLRATGDEAVGGVPPGYNP